MAIYARTWIHISMEIIWLIRVKFIRSYMSLVNSKLVQQQNRTLVSGVFAVTFGISTVLGNTVGYIKHQRKACSNFNDIWNDSFIWHCRIWGSHSSVVRWVSNDHLLSRWFLAQLIFSTLKMEAVCSSETSFDTQRTTQRYIPEDSTLQLIFIEGLHKDSHTCNAILYLM
jgi:hypothetical protein